MATVECSGGVLEVRPVPVLARDGVAYEATLELRLDGEAFGAVGERCAWFVASAAARVRAGDLTSTLEAGFTAWASGAGLDGAWEQASRRLPRDRELLALRSRDPDDLTGAGELRVALHRRRAFAAGAWTTTDVAVLDAWGDGGRGVRAVLDLPALGAFLDALVADLAGVGVVDAPPSGVTLG